MDGLIAFEFCPLCATDWEIWKAEGNEGRGPWGQLSKSMSRNKFQKKWWDGSFFILQRKVVKLSEQLHFWTIYVVDRKKPSLSLRKQLWLHLNISSMETQVHPAHANVRHSSACLEDVYCSWLKHSLCVSFIDDCCRITMEMHGAQKHHETSLQRIDSVQRCQEDLTKMQLFSSRMKTPTTHQVPSCSCQIFKHQDHQVEHTWTYLNIACDIVEQLEVHHFLGDHSISGDGFSDSDGFFFAVEIIRFPLPQLPQLPGDVGGFGAGAIHPRHRPGISHLRAHWQRRVQQPRGSKRGKIWENYPLVN